jgi:hypothetical protein
MMFASVRWGLPNSAAILALALAPLLALLTEEPAVSVRTNRTTTIVVANAAADASFEARATMSRERLRMTER